MNNKYPEFKIDGRMFPLWILHNFKKYNLDPIISNNLDDCNIKQNEDNNKKQIIELYKYQSFIGSYLDYKSPYRDILLYQDMGTGKTATALGVYNMLYNYNSNWNVFILIKAALKDDPWLSDIKKFISDKFKDNEMREKNIHFINYDSPFADTEFINVVKGADITKENIYIIDEAHAFISNVFTNFVENKGKRALTIYNYIQSEKINNKTTRIILLSGTPIVNNPYELVLIFNLLRPGIFPTNKIEFEELYIKSGKTSYLNPETKNMFQRRIIGLVSYYKPPEGNKFAEKNIMIKKIEMSEYQKDIYEHFEAIEKSLKNNKKNVKTTNYMNKNSMNNNSSYVYSAYTRQSCNFVFPFVNKNINGENRPRPSKLNLDDDNADTLFGNNLIKLLKDMELKKDITKFKKNLFIYKNLLDEYINSFKNYLNEINNNDKINKHTLENDIEIFKNKYNMKFNIFWKEHNNKSKLLLALYDSSCKMTSSLFYIMKSKGPILYFSNYVKMEGLELFQVYLKYFGYTNYNDISNKGINGYRYIEFHGDIDKNQRKINRVLFNKDENKYGENIKIMLFSPAGSVGISFMNIRQIHILDPYWNEVRIDQVIGRGIRSCSHKLLPLEERKVDVFRYLSILNNTDKLTTDEKIYNNAKDKQNLINTFLKVLKEISVDCYLFKEHNMIKEKYKCFQFNESSYFDKQIGPAYIDDVYYDKKINDGLNKNGSKIKRIKVIKINAVIKLNDNNYSDTKVYWYNNVTGKVYDYELDYPIGKVHINNEIPNKLNNDIYIIDSLIDIPELNNII